MSQRTSTPQKAKITAHGQTRLCQVVRVHGDPQGVYDNDQGEVLWVGIDQSRANQPQHQPPYCVLNIRDWHGGTRVQNTTQVTP